MVAVTGRASCATKNLFETEKLSGATM